MLSGGKLFGAEPRLKAEDVRSAVGPNKSLDASVWKEKNGFWMRRQLDIMQPPRLSATRKSHLQAPRRSPSRGLGRTPHRPYCCATALRRQSLYSPPPQSINLTMAFSLHEQIPY